MQEPTFTSETNGRRSTSETNSTARRWIFTLNNYTEDELRRIAAYPDFIRWVGFGKEKAPSTGTPHLQGFLYTWDPVRMTKLKHGFLRRARWAIQNEDFESNSSYCGKDNDWTEYGERPQQGKRNDILGVKRRLDQGVPLSTLYEDEAFFSTIMRNERSLTKYAEMQRCKKMREEGRRVPEVYIRVGPTRSGKTSYVYEHHGFGNVYSVPDVTGKWHDGYHGEPVLLYDDVDHTRAPAIEYFKKVTDGYPFQAPYKGGYCYIRPTHIYITSNHQPSEWWPGISQADWAAIKERITEIRLVYKHKEDVVVYHKNATDQAGRQLSDGTICQEVSEVSSGNSEEEVQMEEEVSSRS